MKYSFLTTDNVHLHCRAVTNTGTTVVGGAPVTAVGSAPVPAVGTAPLPAIRPGSVAVGAVPVGALAYRRAVGALPYNVAYNG